MPHASSSTQAGSKTKGPRACGRLACRRSGICHANKRKHLCHSPAARKARDTEMNANLSDLELKARLVNQLTNLVTAFCGTPRPLLRPRRP